MCRKVSQDHLKARHLFLWRRTIYTYPVQPRTLSFLVFLILIHCTSFHSRWPETYRHRHQCKRSLHALHENQRDTVNLWYHIKYKNIQHTLCYERCSANCVVLELITSANTLEHIFFMWKRILFVCVCVWVVKYSGGICWMLGGNGNVVKWAKVLHYNTDDGCRMTRNTTLKFTVVIWTESFFVQWDFFMFFFFLLKKKSKKNVMDMRRRWAEKVSEQFSGEWWEKFRP